MKNDKNQSRSQAKAGSAKTDDRRRGLWLTRYDDMPEEKYEYDLNEEGYIRKYKSDDDTVEFVEENYARKHK